MTHQPVFVSYNHEDRKIVSQVIRRLEEAGIEIWWDDNLLAGQRWTSEIDTALRTARTLVVFIGPQNVSRYQRAEIEAADLRQIPIIPVRLPGAPPQPQLPFLLSNVEYAELTEALDELEFYKLLAAIKGESVNSTKQQELIEKRTRAAVRSYYKSQENKCDHLVFGPHQNQIESRGSDLYVRLHLLSERVQRRGKKATEKEDGSPGDKPPEQTTENQTERDDLIEAIDSDSQLTRERESWEMVFQNTGLRLVFTGDAGSGKSFSLAQEIRKRLSAARNELENSRPLNELELPILVKASALVDTPHARVVDALRAALSISSHDSSTAFEDWWNVAFNSDGGRRLFIVIDGLDELSEESEDRFRSLMNELDVLENANIVVSCRTIYFGSRRTWVGSTSRETRVIEIAPLNTEQQLELVAKWFGDDARCGALQDFLKSNYYARVFCRAPIILTLVCEVYSRTNELPSQNATYASLYEAVVKELLEGRWRGARPEWTSRPSVADQRTEKTKRIALISKITWKIFQSSPSSNRFTETKWLECAQQVATDQKQLDPHELFIELELVGLIIDAGSFGDKDYYYSFAHRTLLEYFAAVGLLETEPDWVKIIVQHMWCERGWEEVIRFAASMTENPKELFDAVTTETGTAKTPVRPLQRLDQICATAGGYSFAILFLLALFIAVFIFRLSGEKWTQLKTHSSHLSSQFQATTAADLRERPILVIKSRTNDVFTFYALTADVFHSELVDTSTLKRRVLYQALTWGHFLWPMMLMVLIMSWVGGVFSGFAKKIFYGRNFPNQDDVFRTGLRLQAEIVGLSAPAPTNGPIPVEDVQRILRDLLASEKEKSLNLHGASYEGFIPENLLLLLAGNALARRVLSEECLRVVEQRIRELRKKNRSYNRALSFYRWILYTFSEDNVEVTLQPGDIKDLPNLIQRLANRRIVVSDYLHRRLESQNSLNGEPRAGSTNPNWSELDWIPDLNKLIHGPPLFDPYEFRHVWWSAETIEMISRPEQDRDHTRLNRLLLEDAFPKTLWSFQKPWIRRLGRFGLFLVNKFVFRKMSNLIEATSGSRLESALRILSLVPSANNCGYMESLLEETANASCCLFNAGRTLGKFTRLDVYAAKVLAISGGPDKIGKLFELSNRSNEYNSALAFAINELSFVNQGEGIRAAAACLTAKFKEDSYEVTKLKEQTAEVLRAAGLSRVAEEIVQMNLDPSVISNNILGSMYDLHPSDKARAFLQTVIDNEVLPEPVKSSAEEKLLRPYDRDWFYPAESLEGYAKTIRTRLDGDELDEAVKCFDESISNYRIDYGSNTVPAALDKIAAACDKRLLDRYFERHGNHECMVKACRFIARLARGQNGRIFQQSLIEWVNQLDFDSSMYDSDTLEIKTAALQALGSLKTKAAEQALLSIWQRTYLSRSRFRRFLEDLPTGFWIALITALEKYPTEESFHAIQYEARKKQSWVICLIAARALRERDAAEALRLFLEGRRLRGSEKWKPEYGVEPQLLDFAFACKARIRKITEDRTWYIATSPSLKSPIRVSAY